MGTFEVPVRGKAQGDVSRTTVARFVRAGDGDPRFDNPEPDDNGSTVSKGDLRLARGPMVGMTLGGRNIRVGIARDLLSPKTNLFITTRGSAALEVVWPTAGKSTLSMKAPAEVDVVLLRAVAASSGAGDDKRAKADAENELLLAPHLVVARDAFIAKREASAAQYVKSLSLGSTTRESSFETLSRKLREAPDEPRYAAARKDMQAYGAKVQSVYDTLEHLDAMNVLDEIAKSTTVLDKRLTAAKSADARRAGSMLAAQSEAVVELRVGSATGPIVAELGVVLFPLIEVEIMPHVVALGANEIAKGTGIFDTTDTDFAAPTDFSKGTFTFVDVVALVARMNVILAPVGVRCFVQKSAVRRYRVHDVTTAANQPGDYDKWNKVVPGFDDLFVPNGSLPVGLNLDDRAEPWANVVMNANAHRPETAHRLNVYFVAVIPAGPNGSIQAAAFNDETQTQGAETIAFKGLYGTPFEMAFGPDQLGVLVSVHELRRLKSRFEGWLTLGRALAHELGHLGTLPHYLGGEANGNPVAAFEHIWAARNLMHCSALVTKAPAGAKTARDVGYGSFGSDPYAGTHLTLKNYKAPSHGEKKSSAAAAPAQAGRSVVTARSVPYEPRATQQALLLRQYLRMFK